MYMLIVAWLLESVSKMVYLHVYNMCLFAISTNKNNHALVP